MSAPPIHGSEDAGRIDAVLARASQEWRGTFDAIDTPILLLDLAGRIIRLNRCAQRTSERTFQELIGSDLAALGPGQPWVEAHRLFEEIRRHRVSRTGHVRDELGRSWEIAASLAHAEDPGDERVIVSARDVSATVRLEASLRRAEGLAAIGDMVAGIAHEVRNPLFAISSIVEVIAARVGPDAGLDEHVSLIRGEVDRLSRLMQDLFDYGKSGALDLERGEVGEVIHGVADRMRLDASSRGVSIRNEVPARFAELRLDARRLAQALENVVRNALQLSPPGATVAIDGWTSRRASASWVDLAVSDSGPGFDPAELHRVFEPFFTRRKGGTGLGLSLVKRITEAHGGQVTAENRPEGGALVVLSLPMDVGPAEPGGE